MIYVFCDEDISSNSSFWLYYYSTVAFSQRKFNSSVYVNIERLRNGGTSLLVPINEMFKATGGFALISYARVPNNLLPTGVKFKTADIPSMSPKDFAWSLSMIFTVAYLVRLLLEQKWTFKTADVFYDPKSLSREHKSEMEKYLQDRLKIHIKQFLQSMEIDRRVNVRRVKAVNKPQPEAAPDKFQLGTWLADRIVRRYNQVVNMEKGDFIKTQDITQDLVALLNEFQNKGQPIP